MRVSSGSWTETQRFWLLPLAGLMAVFCFSQSVPAQETLSLSPDEEEPLMLELEDLTAEGEDWADLPSLPKWQPFYTLRTGAGYRDNVLYSDVNKQESAFLAGGLDLFLSRLTDPNNQVDLFLTYDEKRYLASVDVETERLGFAQAHWVPRLGPGVQADLALEYIFQDQVLDVSATETNLAAEKVTGHTLVPRPGLHWDLQPGGLWSELFFPVERQWFEPPLDDYTEYGPQVILGHPYGRQSEVQLTYEYTYRLYDENEVLDEDGVPVAGTRRAFQQQEVGVLWRHHHDGEKRWRSSLRFSFKRNADNGSGYFDFDRYRAGYELRFRTAQWEVRAEARYARYHYDVQTVSATDPSLRERDEFQLGLRLERKLASFLRLYAEYERDQTDSNIDVEQYTVNTAVGGLLWEF